MTGQKRRISGWVVLNKPADTTSTRAVGKIKWLYQAKKAGHAGTLDPLATGVLPIALGEATKTVPYVQHGMKIYEFDISWGVATSTGDSEGDVIATSAVRPDPEELQAALPEFIGHTTQIPPVYSAIRINGERAYDLARAGMKFDVPSREVEISALELVSHDHTCSTLRVTCGKGTYVRALARDIAQKLGTHGHVSRLHRAQVAHFSDKDAITIAALEDMQPSARDATLRPLREALLDLEQICLGSQQAQLVRAGNSVILTGRGAPIAAERAYATHRSDVVAIGRIEQGRFKPGRVILAP